MPFSDMGRVHSGGQRNRRTQVRGGRPGSNKHVIVARTYSSKLNGKTQLNSDTRTQLVHMQRRYELNIHGYSIAPQTQM